MDFYKLFFNRRLTVFNNDSENINNVNPFINAIHTGATRETENKTWSNK